MRATIGLVFSLIIIIVLIALFAWWKTNQANDPSSSPKSGTLQASSSQPANSPSTLPTQHTQAYLNVAPTDGKGIHLLPETATAAEKLHTPNTTTKEDLEILDLLVATFRRSNDGANPAGGLNDEIVSQLRGQNTKHLAVLPPDHPAIDKAGQLLDRWDTPYDFHPVSRDVLEIRSAGPDKQLWTEDDILSEH